MPKYSPLFWFGSKGSQLKRLKMVLPESFDYLVEPFTGSASFSLAMISECFIGSSNVWLNDKNPALVAFMKAQRDNHCNLISELLALNASFGLGTEELYVEAIDVLQHSSSTRFDLAIAQYVANKLGFGGKAPNRNNYCDPLKSGHGLRVSAIMDLTRFAELLKGTKLTYLDYREIEPPTSDTLMYLDAPYGDDASSTPDWDSYGKGFTISESDYFAHCESLKDKCHILISHGDTPATVEAFQGWNVFRVPVLRPSRAEKNQTELIITNYDIPFSEMLDDEEWELAA